MVKILSSYINFAIGQYIVEPKKTLKNWVKPYVQTDQLKDPGYIYYNNIDTPDDCYLSSNNSITAKVILKKDPSKIEWDNISENTSKWAYKLLKPDKINWRYLSGNPSKWAYKLLKNNLDKISSYWLSINPSEWAFRLLKPENIDWAALSVNKSKWALKLLESNPDKINWKNISMNPSAYKLLEQLLAKPKVLEGSLFLEPNKVDLYYLSENPSKWAYKILKDMPSEIYWIGLSKNPYILKSIKNNKCYKHFDNLLYSLKH